MLLFFIYILFISIESLNIDRKGITVFGVGAGANAAVQFQIAHSSLIKGAASIGGSPFMCSEGDRTKAIEICMANPEKLLSTQIISRVKDFESSGLIDSLDNLKDHKIYVYHGKNDNVFNHASSEKLIEQYKQLGANVDIQVLDHDSNHGVITDYFGNECNSLYTPFINNCGYDQAYEFLKLFYDIKKEIIEPKESNYVEFDQFQFGVEDFDRKGIFYIPDSCRNGEKCKVLFAFHGGEQCRESVGDTFVKNSGIARYAEANNIIVIFPQMKPVPLVKGWSGCFDFYGASGEEYATKEGKQIQAFIKMIDILENQL